MTPARSKQPPLQQRSGGSSACKQGGIGKLFNRALAVCSYGDKCILSIDAQSAGALTMVEGIVQMRLEAQDHKKTQVTGEPTGRTFYYM